MPQELNFSTCEEEMGQSLGHVAERAAIVADDLETVEVVVNRKDSMSNLPAKFS